MASTHLVISTANELLRVQARSIIYISSDGNYSNLLLQGGEVRLVTYQLGQIERMIADQLHDDRTNFVRIGKSLIINMNNVFFINVSKQQLLLTDNTGGVHIDNQRFTYSHEVCSFVMQLVGYHSLNLPQLVGNEPHFPALQEQVAVVTIGGYIDDAPRLHAKQLICC